MTTYYGPDGKPLTLEEWAVLFESRKEDSDADGDDSWWRIKTEVGDVTVSTVWIGIDHNFGGEGPPLIFESMVSSLDGEFEARAGHAKLVDQVQKGTGP